MVIGFVVPASAWFTFHNSQATTLGTDLLLSTFSEHIPSQHHQLHHSLLSATAPGILLAGRIVDAAAAALS